MYPLDCIKLVIYSHHCSWFDQLWIGFIKNSEVCKKKPLTIVNLLKNSYSRISFLLINKIKAINILFDDLKLAQPRFSSKV